MQDARQLDLMHRALYSLNPTEASIVSPMQPNVPRAALGACMMSFVKAWNTP